MVKNQKFYVIYLRRFILPQLRYPTKAKHPPALRAGAARGDKHGPSSLFLSCYFILRCKNSPVPASS